MNEVITEKPDARAGDSDKSVVADEPMMTTTTTATMQKPTEPIVPSPEDEHVWLAASLSAPRHIALVFVVCMAHFCLQSAFASPLFLQNVIGASFGETNPGQLAWLVAGYSLTVGSFILLSGRAGDLFGYKRMLLIGFGWFSVWSVITGLGVYQNYTLVIFARVLQGIGPAICVPNGLAILGSVYPPGPVKAMVFACFGAVAPMGGVIGCIVSASLAIHFWPWLFWMLGIWLAVLAVMAYIVVPDIPQQSPAFDDGFSFKKLSAELDIPGSVTGVMSLILFNFAWNQAPIVGWDTAEVIVPLIAGLAVFGLFAFIETKVATRPLVPFDAINADVCYVLAAVSCGWASFSIWIFYFARILEDVRHLSALQACIRTLPIMVSGMVAAMTTGALLGPLQVRLPVVLVISLTAFMTGTTLLAAVPLHQVYWGQYFVSALVMPFGMDMSFPAATLIISNAVKREHQGTGASLVTTLVNYSISLAVGISGTVQVHVGHGDLFQSLKGGLYFGIGIAVLGWSISIIYLIRDQLKRGKKGEVTANA
ncbi:major facilitator superfamily transporter [Xylaria sp. CBS 124048]|nr:major facilitator superfamily transporter [Xylaria sp. CBS 124048]